MADRLFPTPTRLRLLESVADGEVWQNSNGESVETDRKALGLSDFYRRVTAAIAEMERAGWVHVVELQFGARQWQLTKTGRELLEDCRG